MRYLNTRAAALVIEFFHIWTPNSDILDDKQWLNIDYFLSYKCHFEKHILTDDMYVILFDQQPAK